jgi:hypothetical protein
VVCLSVWHRDGNALPAVRDRQLHLRRPLVVTMMRLLLGFFSVDSTLRNLCWNLGSLLPFV